MLKTNKVMISLTTEADGKQTVFKTEGTAVSDGESVCFHYKNQVSEVRFSVGKTAYMEHSGDYGLKFYFEPGKTTLSEMEIEGEVAEFPLKTKEYHYRITDEKIMVYIKYILKFEGGYQNMKVKFIAVPVDSSEEEMNAKTV